MAVRPTTSVYNRDAMRRPVTGAVALAFGVVLASVSAGADPPPRADDVAVAPPLDAPGSLALSIDPPGAEVVVDGAVVGTTPLAELPLATGPHHVEVRAAERLPWVRDLVVVAGERVDIAIALLPAPPPAPPTPVMPPPPPAPPTPPPPVPRAMPLGRGPIFWTGVAVTGALVALGSVTGGVALGQQAEYEDAGTSLARRRDLYDSMNGLATATDVLLDSALVVGVATALLFACAGPEEGSGPTSHGPFEWIGAHCF